tara:strand:+ start:87 stop:536 length:450 start_codon:yes stop_codon:yes gene_type:complete
MNATFVVVVSSYVRPSVVPVTAPEHTIVAATPIAVSLLTPPQSVAVSVVGATEACVVQQMWFPFVSPLIVYVAPASSGLVPCAIVGMQRLVGGSHIVPAPQSEACTGQTVAAFSPLPRQQQRRVTLEDEAEHVDDAALLAQHDPPDVLP